MGLLCTPPPRPSLEGVARRETLARTEGRCHRRPYLGRGLGGAKGIAFSSAGAPCCSLARLLCSKQTRLFCLSNKTLSLAFKALRGLASADPADVLPSSSPSSSGHPSRTGFLALPQAHQGPLHLRAFARATPSVLRPPPRPSHGLLLLPVQVLRKALLAPLPRGLKPAHTACPTPPRCVGFFVPLSHSKPALYHSSVSLARWSTQEDKVLSVLFSAVSPVPTTAAGTGRLSKYLWGECEKING